MGVPTVIVRYIDEVVEVVEQGKGCGRLGITLTRLGLYKSWQNGKGSASRYTSEATGFLQWKISQSHTKGNRKGTPHGK